MALFGVFSTSGSALGVYRTWLDAISDNIANINTARPTSQPAFQARYVVARSNDAGAASGFELPGGAQVQQITYGDPLGRVVNDPANPLADAAGNVRMPDIDLGEQMTYLLLAQRGYQANLAVIERAKDSYQAALELG